MLKPGTQERVISRERILNQERAWALRGRGLGAWAPLVCKLYVYCISAVCLL